MFNERKNGDKKIKNKAKLRLELACMLAKECDICSMGSSELQKCFEHRSVRRICA